MTMGDAAAEMSMQRAMPGPGREAPLPSVVNALRGAVERLEGQFGDLRGKLNPLLTQSDAVAKPSLAVDPTYTPGSSEAVQELIQILNGLSGLSDRLWRLQTELEV